MQRLFVTILLSLFLGMHPAAHAQRGDMVHFARFEGLERVIARSWFTPIPGAEPIASPAASPVATLAATPLPEANVVSLSVFVYLFQTDENAAAGFERIDADLREIRDSDSRAPMEEYLPLDGVGDRANGYMGEIEQDDGTLTHTFVTVQDGPFVYSISGVFTNAAPESLTREYAGALVASQMDRMKEQFDKDGSSRGGMWSKLNGVQPDMPSGSIVNDLIIYPMPESAMAAYMRSLIR